LISLKWSMSNVASAIGLLSRPAWASSRDACSLNPRPIEQAGQRVGTRFAAQPLEQKLAPALEDGSDDCDRGGRHHHVDPASGVGARSGQEQQGDGLPDRDARDYRDGAAEPEEDRRPQDRQRIKDRPVARPRRRRQCVGDQGDADRAEQGQRPAREPRTDCQQRDEQNKDDDHREQREFGIARQEALDRAIERSGTVHRGRGVRRWEWAFRPLRLEL
jgi:hypothetical protein